MHTHITIQRTIFTYLESICITGSTSDSCDARIKRSNFPPPPTDSELKAGEKGRLGVNDFCLYIDKTTGFLMLGRGTHCAKNLRLSFWLAESFDSEDPYFKHSPGLSDVKVVCDLAYMYCRINKIHCKADAKDKKSFHLTDRAKVLYCTYFQKLQAMKEANQ